MIVAQLGGIKKSTGNYVYFVELMLVIIQHYGKLVIQLDKIYSDYSLKKSTSSIHLINYLLILFIHTYK